jgi:hypothetical protein
MTTFAALITIETDDPTLALPCATEAQAQRRKRAVQAAYITHVVDVMTERDGALAMQVIEMLREDQEADA